MGCSTASCSPPPSPCPPRCPPKCKKRKRRCRPKCKPKCKPKCRPRCPRPRCPRPCPPRCPPRCPCPPKCPRPRPCKRRFKNKPCCRKGPVTRNPFLNFLRQYRVKHCNWTTKKIAIMGAAKWCSMNNCEKKKYKTMARLAPKRRPRKGCAGRKPCQMRRSKRRRFRRKRRCSRAVSGAALANAIQAAEASFSASATAI